MPNYMKLISKCHPGIKAACHGDPTVYSDIEWIDTPIPQATLDTQELDVNKTQRRLEVDQRTQELIAEGFTYNSNVFSLSELAQINWIGLSHADIKGIITYPVGVTTKYDGEYSIVDAQELNTFFMTGVGAKKAHLDSGRALKLQINAATTQAELDAVVDNR